MAPFGVRVAGHRKQMRWGLMEGVTVGNFERTAPEPWLESGLTVTISALSPTECEPVRPVDAGQSI